MSDYYLLKERLDLTRKEIRQSINYAYEDDEFTQGYQQGLIDAMAMCEWLFDTIDDFHDRQVQEDKLTSNAIPTDGQIRLFD